MTTADRGEIRLAATVIVARPGASGPEVLVMRRSSSSPFLGGYVVFPGGSVDDEDADGATRWFGDAAQATRAAAVRELVEEAGLALTADGLVVTTSDEGGFAAVDRSPPAVGALARIAHWVAPEEVPVRFDAHYFAIATTPGIEPRADGHEAERVWWADPGELMRDWAEGDVLLYWPTMVTMEALAGCATVDEILALDVVAREPDADEEQRVPRSTIEAERS